MLGCPSWVMNEELLEMLLLMVVFVLGWFVTTRFFGAPISSRTRTSASKPSEALQQFALAANLEACLTLWAKSGPLKVSLKTLDIIASMLHRTTSIAHLETAADMSLNLRSSSLAGAVLSASSHCDLSWRTATAARFLAENLELSAISITELLWACAQNQQHKKAFDLWKLNGTAADLDSSPYEAMLEICIEAGDMSLAAEVARFEHWRTPDSQYGRSAIWKVIRWLIDHDLETAMIAYRMSLTRPASFDLVTFRSLLGALARSSNVAEALELVDESLKHGLRLDHDCFAILVKAYCKHGAPSLAADLLADMRDYRPTASLCEVVLKACVSVRDAPVAKRTLELMAALSMRPSSTVLASVVRLLGKEGYVHELISVIHGLPCLDVDLHVHDTLLRVLFAGDHVDCAFEQMRIMKDIGLSPSSMTCDIVLEECLRQGQLCHAAAFVEEALESGRVMSPQLLHNLLQAIGRRGTLQAMPLAHKLISAGVEVPQSLLDALQRGNGHASLMARRRSEWHQWRSKFGDHVASAR